MHTLKKDEQIFSKKSSSFMNLLSSLKISNIPKQANFLKIAQKPLFTKVTEGRY